MVHRCKKRRRRRNHRLSFQHNKDRPSQFLFPGSKGFKDDDGDDGEEKDDDGVIT